MPPSALATMMGQQVAPAAAAAATPPRPAAPAPTAANSALTQMGVDPSLVSMLDERRASHQQLSQTALEDLDDISARRRDIMDAPLERPEVPDLPEMPEQPAGTIPGNGRRVYGQFLPVLAMLGGALVRRDATAALRTGAAAMAAARANDRENLELQHQHFETQVQQVINNRQTMLDQYRAALEDASLDMNQRTALLGALAAQENNIELRTRVSMGDLDGIANNINTQMRAVEALRNQHRADAEANSRIAARERAAANGGTGRIGTPEQRSRIILSMPQAVAALERATQIENESIPQGGTEGTNPYSRDSFAAVVGGLPGVGAMAERALTEDDPTYQQYDQAIASMEQAFLPMFAGMAQTEGEARRWIRSNTPQIGNSWEVIVQKRTNMQRLINQAAIVVGQAPPYPDAGQLDPSDPNAARVLRALAADSAGGGAATGGGNADGAGLDFEQAPTILTQEDYDALPSGSAYFDSEGNRAVKP